MNGAPDAPSTAAPPSDGESTGDPSAAAQSYRDNAQRVDQGVAFMGDIRGDAYFMGLGSLGAEEVNNHILKPRLREGTYPATDVEERLRRFVEPPTYGKCRKTLDSRILLLRADAQTGGERAAFALLAERHGAGGITGVDLPDGLTDWVPKESRGYLLQELSPRAADSLGEVALNALADLLREVEAHLVVTVRPDTKLHGDTAAWQVAHTPPDPAEVTAKHLAVMAETGELSPAQAAQARQHLTSAGFTEYLGAHHLPGDAVEVAEGLRDLVVSHLSPDTVLDGLRTGTPEAARRALAESRHHADRLALMAAVSLLSGQDRAVVQQFSAKLRPRIAERLGQPGTGGTPPGTEAGGPEPSADGNRTGPDFLGPTFEERLQSIGARPLKPRFDTSPRYRVQPVVFSQRHRSDALLRCLWLDYEGMAGLLWAALNETPYCSGMELAAGRAIGRVLAHATGPGTLGQLRLFATSDTRWRRRLVAYALGEMAQHPVFTVPVREQLRQWSKAADIPLRCTVAETCAGSYGLAHPGGALRLLDTVLAKEEATADAGMDDDVRRAVSFALGTLLSEDANHPLVLDRLREWQTADPGTGRHAMAAHVIETMCGSAFPPPGVPSERRVRLSELLAEHPDRALPLVVAALDDSGTHRAAADGLALIESDPELRIPSAFPQLLAALVDAARTHRGVLRFVLARQRAHARMSFSEEGALS